MGSKDYYTVLGVPRTASRRGIRRAFRSLAREHHPDHAGPTGAPAFREVVEAYRVLSDPARRREHDARLRAREAGTGRARRRGPTLRRQTSGPRPADPAPIDLSRGAPAPRPSVDAWLERLRRGFADAGPVGRESDVMHCDVTLRRSEALRGGVLPLRVPAVAVCPDCAGAGDLGGLGCGRCATAGRLRTEVAVPLEIPPGIRSGTVCRIPLDPCGLPDVRLRVRIHVEG